MTQAAVPDFKACKAIVDCNMLAQEFGFKVDFVVVGKKISSFKVLEVSPPVGTLLPKGSRITITRTFIRGDLVQDSIDEDEWSRINREIPPKKIG